MDIKEIEEWWAQRPAELLKRPINGYWAEVTDWLIQRVKELETELAKIKSDSSVKAIIDWKEWIDKRPRSPVYEE